MQGGGLEIRWDVVRHSIFFLFSFLFIYWGILNRENMYRGAKVWEGTQGRSKSRQYSWYAEQGMGREQKLETGVLAGHERLHTLSWKAWTISWRCLLRSLLHLISQGREHERFNYCGGKANREEKHLVHLGTESAGLGCTGARNLQIKQLLGSPIKQKKKLVFKSMVCG